MTIRIEPVDKDPWIRQMLYSYPGHGKTSYIGTSGEVGRTLIVRSSIDLFPARVLDLPNLEMVTCDTHEQMLEVLEMARMSADWPYLWVWWDCASIAQEILLDDVWEAAWQSKPQRNWILDGSGKPTKKPNITPTGGKDKPEYGTNMDRIGQWVRHMIGCKRFHFGIAAHPEEGNHPTNDEAGTLLRPAIQGKNMPERLCGYMNQVAFLELDDTDPEDPIRRLRLRENSRFYAKDQYDAFPDDGYLESPTVKNLMRAVEDARGKPLGTLPGVRTSTQPARGGRRGAGTTPTAGRRKRGASGS